MSLTPVDGSVYLMHCYSDGLCKIGITDNLIRRKRRATRHPGAYAELLFEGLTSDPAKIQRFLHRTFRAKRIYDDWFYLDSSDLDFIQALIQA